MAGLGLPMPQSGAAIVDEGIQKVFDQMRQRQLQPYQLALLKAQAQEAQGKGLESQWIAKWLGAGGQGGMTPVPAGSPANQPVDTGQTTNGAPPDMTGATGGASGPSQDAIVSSLLHENPISVNGGVFYPATGHFVPVGQSPTEKGQQEVSVDTQKKQNEANLKIKDSAIADAQAAIKFKRLVKNNLSLLEKNPKLTGFGKEATVRINPDPDASTFQANTGPLWAEAEKELSTRGSVQAMNNAKTLKMSLGGNYAYNKGMGAAALDKFKEQYKTAKANYERVTGKPFPVSDEDFDKAEEQQEQPATKTRAAGEPVIPQSENYSEGAKRLAKSVKIPDFGSDQKIAIKKFNDWFWHQPKITRDAVSIKLHMEDKNNG